MQTTSLFFSAFYFCLALAESSHLLTLSQTSSQRPHRQPCRHPVTTPITLPTSSDHTNDPADIQYQPHQQPCLWPANRQWPVIDQPPINHLSSTDLYIIWSINLRPFSCYTVALAFVSPWSWLFTLIHVCKPSRNDILISPTTTIWLNWMAWNRTVYLYRNGFGIK